MEISYNLSKGGNLSRFQRKYTLKCKQRRATTSHKLSIIFTK
jgi:hypothetical protein